MFRQPYILLVLRGAGLGNQLFQYAAGLKLSVYSGIPLVIDATSFGTDGAGPDKWERSFLLDQFRTSARICTDEERLRLSSNDFRSRLLRLWDRTLSGGQSGLIIESKEQHRRPHPKMTDQKIRRSMMLFGYFESACYAESIESHVRNEFRFLHPPDAMNQDFIARIESSNSVAIHVRGGDILERPNQDWPRHSVGADYYQRAIARIRQSVSNAEFFVFSDDVNHARGMLELRGVPTTFVQHNGNEHPIEDLRLMSHCKHHILTSSTFGWWGAWLGKNPDQIVIAPNRYFLDETTPLEHYYPKHWMLI